MQNHQPFDFESQATINLGSTSSSFSELIWNSESSVNSTQRRLEKSQNFIAQIKNLDVEGQSLHSKGSKELKSDYMFGTLLEVSEKILVSSYQLPYFPRQLSVMFDSLIRY